MFFDLDRFAIVFQLCFNLPQKPCFTRLSDFSDFLQLDGNYHGTQLLENPSKSLASTKNREKVVKGVAVFFGK